jgi:hypothetical protein
MKRTLRIVSIVFLGLIFFLFIFFITQNEQLPEGTSGPEADAMAEKMMESLNYEAWQVTPEVSWTFKGIHSYRWDKMENVVNVKWDNHEVILKPEDKSGIVQNGENYSSQEIEELINTSWDYFNNDSFWLYAPFKAFDPGTERSIVRLKDGRQGLKVTYTSGGSTPGDSYVWILDENHRPTSVKMWVSILPLGGMEFTWENYKTLESGAMIAQDHWLYGSVNIDISDLDSDMNFYEGFYEVAFSDIIEGLGKEYSLLFESYTFDQRDLNMFASSISNTFQKQFSLDSTQQHVLDTITWNFELIENHDNSSRKTVSIMYSSPMSIGNGMFMTSIDFQFGNEKRRIGSIGYIVVRKENGSWKTLHSESVLEF